MYPVPHGLAQVVSHRLQLALGLADENLELIPSGHFTYLKWGFLSKNGSLLDYYNP